MLKISFGSNIRKKSQLNKQKDTVNRKIFNTTRRKNIEKAYYDILDDLYEKSFNEKISPDLFYEKIKALKAAEESALLNLDLLV